MRWAWAAGSLMLTASLAGAPAAATAERGGVSEGHIILDADDPALSNFTFLVRYRVQPAFAKVSAVCFGRLPGDFAVQVGLGLAAAGTVELVETRRSSGDAACDDAITDGIWQAGPYPPVPAELLARVPAGRPFVVALNFAGTRSAPVRRREARPPVPGVSPGVVLVGALTLAALVVVIAWATPWRRRRQPAADDGAQPAPAAAPAPVTAEPSTPMSAASGLRARFRLTIDFTDRQAMLDFVAVLKRDELLPAAAQTHRIDPATAALSPATEAYVVIRSEADTGKPTA